jgi:NAD(P)-dependent dehydrogenase (short-subunit alcohol dehydrogenase family)
MLLAISSSTALIIGCGDIAIASARLIGRRHHLLMTDIDAERLKDAAGQMRDAGYSVEQLPCDVTNEVDVENLGNYLANAPELKIVAHVAALAPSVTDWRKLMAVNLVGPHLIARHIGPRIIGGGAAVFVGSVAAYMAKMTAELENTLKDPLAGDFWEKLEAAVPTPMTATLAYLYSKAALVEFCETLAIAWGERQVRVISVSPGLIKSAMGARERAHNPDSGRFVACTPLGREGSVGEAAAVIDFAASDHASFLNGVDILADGGLRATLRRNKDADR